MNASALLPPSPPPAPRAAPPRPRRGGRGALLALLATLVALAGPLTAARAEVELGADEYVVFHHHDALGSPTAATDAAGNLLWYEYAEPYGRSSGRLGADGRSLEPDPWQLVEEEGRSRVGYTGHVRDGASGLLYMQARYYDPELGRFLSDDPVGVTGAIPATFNRYAYANNNPYRFTDPDGRDARDVQIILSDIKSNFPGMRQPHSVMYESLPARVAGQTTLHPTKPSLVLPVEAQTATLTKDDFNALYGTVLHESMHVTDSFWQRIWDGIWGNDSLTKNHEDINARTSYEMIQLNSEPVEDVWDKDGEVKRPKGVDTDTLFETTREEDSDL